MHVFNRLKLRYSLRPRSRRTSPLVPILTGALLAVLIAIGAVAYFSPNTTTSTHAAEFNPDCTLIVPDQPLTAQGLATPYRLEATDRDAGPCHESNINQSAFVQGAVINPATGQISIYNPLVIDKNSEPAAAPVVPQLPANGIVALWFGYNAGNLTLKGANDQVLENNNCVNGVKDSVFSQYAYCNAQAFFQTANQAIAAGKLVPPVLGTGKDGRICPSVRDFSAVDMDQSDNVNTAYLATNDGKIAQMNAANTAQLQDTQLLVNASDNRLISIALDGTLGCIPWTAPDLADPGHTVTALPLDELQAAAHQQQPMAVVPNDDPMVLVNGNHSLKKLNAYRIGVDQPVIQNAEQGSTRTYCTNLLNIGPERIQHDQPFTQNIASPAPAVASNLFTFLAQRFVMTWGAMGLNCQELLHEKSPIKLKMEDNMTVDATFKNPLPGQGTTQGPVQLPIQGPVQTPIPAPVHSGISCSINGQVLAGCTGTTTINNQNCTFTNNVPNGRIEIVCPTK